MVSFPVVSQETLKDRVIREGDPWLGQSNSNMRWTGVTVGAGQGVGGGNTQPNIKAFWLESLTLSASEACYIQSLGPFLQYVSPNGTAPIGSTFVQSGSYTVPAGGTIVVPIQGLFDSQHQVPGFSLMQVFEQDPKMSIPSLSANVALTYNKNGGPSNQNTIVAGDKYSTLFNIINNSGSPTSGTVTVVDKVPSQCRVISSSGTGWTIGVVGDVLTATTSDVIANGATKPFTVVYENTKLVRAATSIFGYSVDVDIAADLPPIWWCGTSITAGSTPTSYIQHFTYKTRNWLRDVKGISTRVFNRGVGGASSIAQELLRATNNRYETLQKPRMAVYEEGINDSAQGVPTATTIANMQAYVAHVRRKSATCPIFIWAPLPTGNVGYEALNQALHLVYGPAVAALGDSKVYYVSTLRTAWNPVTQDATYTTDTIHPNDAGNQKIVDVFTAFMDTVNLGE